ncbi:MAG: pilin [Patescibacteria group bacterium]|nr:pilin [Patescibacteria group bacterium]
MNSKFFLFFILFLGFIILINFSLAQNSTNTTNSANSNQNSSQTNVVNSGTKIPSLKEKEPGKLINQFYEFLLIISGFLAFATIVYGGIQRILNANNPSKISDANERIKSAFLGILLLFGAYILLRLVNPNLVNLKLPELEEIKVEQEKVSANTQATNVEAGKNTATGKAGRSLSDTEARTILKNNGIDSKLTNTTLEGIKEGTINELIRMKKECDEWLKKWYPNESQNGCYVYVTGGTENIGVHNPGACSHANGYKIDIAVNSRLDEFIKKTYCFEEGNDCTYYDIRVGDNALMYKSPTGSFYARETNPPHWDIQITSQCP